MNIQSDVSIPILDSSISEDEINDEIQQIKYIYEKNMHNALN